MYFIEKSGKIYADNWINGYGEVNYIYDISDGTKKVDKKFEASQLKNEYKIDGVSYTKSGYETESAKWLKNKGWKWFYYNSSTAYWLDSKHSAIKGLRADFTDYLFKG